MFSGYEVAGHLWMGWQIDRDNRFASQVCNVIWIVSALSFMGHSQDRQSKRAHLITSWWCHAVLFISGQVEKMRASDRTGRRWHGGRRWAGSQKDTGEWASQSRLLHVSGQGLCWFNGYGQVALWALMLMSQGARLPKKGPESLEQSKSLIVFPQGILQVWPAICPPNTSFPKTVVMGWKIRPSWFVP